MAITIRSKKTFDTDFPKVIVGPRSGTGRRTQDAKELWALRRALRCALKKRLVRAPFSVLRVPASQPFATTDFVLINPTSTVFVEITEATSPLDQREMSITDQDAQATMLGTHGGRGARGFVGDEPERLVAEDIETAVRRKRERYPSKLRRNTILAVYVNSNPNVVIGRLTRLARLKRVRRLRNAGFREIIIFDDSATFAL